MIGSDRPSRTWPRSPLPEEGVVERKERALDFGGFLTTGAAAVVLKEEEEVQYSGGGIRNGRKIEKSELEKLYGAAAAYSDSEDGKEAMSRLNSDVQMQLYALQKVATEGPCYEPQPTALKVAARSKWSAWQRLGSMNPEVAMEQYINLLSEKDSWMEGRKSWG